MKVRKTAILSFVSLLLSVSFASAAPLDFLTGPFSTLLDMLKDETIVFGFTFIFFFMLLYGIYAAALKFVPVFKGDSGLSRQGKVVAIALSGLSTLSIFYFTRGKGMAAVLRDVLEPFGVFAGLALAALFAGVTYFGIRGTDNTSKSLALTAGAAGFGMVIAGMILTWDNIMMWGFFIMFLAMLIGLLFRNWGSGRGDGGGPVHEDENGKRYKEGPDGRRRYIDETPEAQQEGQEPGGATPIIENVEVDPDNIRVTFWVR